jgi:hypothetical protein
MHARNKQKKKSNQHEKDCLVGGVSIYTKKYTERQRYRRTAPLCSAFFFLTRSSKSESDIKSNQIVLDPNQKKENIKPNQIKTEKKYKSNMQGIVVPPRPPQLAPRFFDSLLQNRTGYLAMQAGRSADVLQAAALAATRAGKLCGRPPAQARWPQNTQWA